MSKLIHTMIRVHDLQASEVFYSQVLGLKRRHVLDFETFTLVYLGNEQSEFELELTYNKGGEAYTHGTGYGHVAVVTDDLDAEHARLHALGYQLQPIKEFYDGTQLIARFFFIQDPDGYKIEVLQKHGHYR